MKSPKVMVIIGTRPECIKLAPVIQVLKSLENELTTITVATGQHRSMLDQVLRVFDIRPDYDLKVMRSDQSLAEVTVRLMAGLDRTIKEAAPSLVLVQGDTTTALAGGLAAYYQRVPLGHVEAGLRTDRKYDPFPEELNRRLVDVIADISFAPTASAKQALLRENIPEEQILVTGNTVVDAIMTVANGSRPFESTVLREIDFDLPLHSILVTAHRRESFGKPLESVCTALKELLASRSDIRVIFPVHRNPKVRDTVFHVLEQTEGIFLVAPLSYRDFVQLMQRCDLIVTDSGGIQEEAPALGKPVLVIRECTERAEALQAGTARLIGTNRESILAGISELLDDRRIYDQMCAAVNPFGDGQSARRIGQAVRKFLGLSSQMPDSFRSDFIS